MPDSDPPDYRTPVPDEGHEAIRRPLAQAIDDLAEAALGVEDAYFLTDLLLGIADNLLTQVDNLQATVAALTAQPDALDPPV